MTKTIIYHNPRCSKSRQTLELIESKGISPVIVEYLKSPLNAGELSNIYDMLGDAASGMARKGEDDYKASGLSDNSTKLEIISALAKHPKLLERPIVTNNGKAIIGRPPENVLAIL